MALRKMRALQALSLLVMFGFAQVYVQAGRGAAPPIPQGARLISARLTTRNGQPITVNGASSTSGATILTGATIETPDQVSATVDLGPLGSIEIGPNSRLQLDFDENGARVNLLRGCVVAKAKSDKATEVYTAEGASEKTNNNRKSMGFCYLNGQLTPGTAGVTAPAAGAGAGGGLSTAAWIGILGGIGGTAAIIAGTAGRGGNPSP